MAQLVTTAVIRAHDQLTGPLRAMAGQVRGINNQFNTGARAVSRSAAGAAAVAGLGLYNLAGMYEQAKRFEEKIFGVGVATVPDTIRTGGDAVETATAQMAKARTAAMELSRALGMDPIIAATIQESVAKAGVAAEHVAAFSESIGLVKLTDQEASVEVLSDWGASLSTLYSEYMKLNNLDPAKFFKKAADAAMIGAAETSLSTGTFISGLQKYAAVTAGFGATPQQNAAFMAAAKKASGQDHIPLGETYKTMALRMVAPTAGNLEAFTRLGLNRASYFEGGDGSVSASKITAALAAMTQTRLRGKERTAFLTEITNAQRTGKLGDETWNAKMRDRLGKVMGLDMRQDANREKVTSMWESALVAGSGKIDFEKLFTDLAKKKGADPTAVVEAFEKKRAAQILGILDAFREDEKGNSIYKAILGTIQKSDGRGLDDVKRLRINSEAGRMAAMESAVKRFTIAIMGSKAATAMISQMADALSALDRVDSRLLNLGVGATMIGLLAGPAVLAAQGLLTLSAAGLGLLSGIGWLAAWPFMRAAQGMKNLAIGMAALGAAGARGTAASGLAWLGRLVGYLGPIARYAAILGAGGALIGLVTNFGEVQKFFETLAASPAASDFMASLSGLAKDLGGLWGDIDKLTKSFLELFGIKTEGSTLMWGVTKLTQGLTMLVEGVRAAIALLRGEASGKPDVGGSGDNPIGPSDPMTGMSYGMPSPITNDPPGPPPDVKIEPSSASIIGQAIATAVRAGLQGISVNVNGGAASLGPLGAGPEAVAPRPGTSNAQGYNGR